MIYRLCLYLVIHMKKTLAGHGFTIIEVIIVLAIASVIILIIFLAVPALQANSRNFQRKDYAHYLNTQMEQYKSDHGGSYPVTAADACDFLKNYTIQSGTAGACTGFFSGGDPVTVDTKYYSVAFFNNDVPHDYI